jgi:hypothetical protein
MNISAIRLEMYYEHFTGTLCLNFACRPMSTLSPPPPPPPRPSGLGLELNLVVTSHWPLDVYRGPSSLVSVSDTFHSLHIY